MEAAMKPVRFRTSALTLALLLVAGLLLCSAVWTQALAATASDISKEIRQAERDMFSGKTDKAIAALENIKTMILDLKAADPNNTSLASLESKYQKLVKDLERRTGKDLGGGTLTAASASTETTLPDKPASEVDSEDAAAATATPAAEAPAAPAAKLPYEARRPMSQVDRLLNSLARNLENLADPEYGGDKDQLVGNIEAKLPEIRTTLDEAKGFAAKKGVTSHPDFDSAEARLTEAEQAVAQAKGGYEEQKAAAAAMSEEIDADVATLKAEYDRVSSIFDAATGTVIYYNDLVPVEELIDKIEDFESNELAAITQAMEAFAAKYGSTREEIDGKADAMGYSGQYRASFPYTELSEGIENVEKTRVLMAEDLVAKAQERLARVQGGEGHDFVVVEQYATVKSWLNMAARYDAENPKVVAAQGGIDEQIAEGMASFNARIDGRTWPGHASNAPKDAKKLAQAALDWFKNSPDWGNRTTDPRHPLAVAVTGPWSVQAKNILGEPIMYGLPVLFACQVDEDKELNVARVYSLTMRTAEERGVAMAPPFDHITVGNSYFIRPSAVK
jgi:hypothetical protein